MRTLVTGSSGHLGEAIVRTLRARGEDVVGLDVRPSPWTDTVGSVTDPDAVRAAMTGADVVLHTATLHKPQLAFVPGQAFIDTNVSGTLSLLLAAADVGARAFVMSSSTTVFGDALVPDPRQPATWIDESVTPVPKNMYGVTKSAAEDLCQLAHRNHGLACVVLRVARFFPERDDRPEAHEGRSDANVKADEYASRRIALEDAVEAHLLAASAAERIGFGRYIVSATTPFLPRDLGQLRTDAAGVFARRVPGVAEVWARRGWRFPNRVDRVYDNSAARADLGWNPRYDLAAIAQLVDDENTVQTPLARLVGSKEYLYSSYHLGTFTP
ncbi:NAD(P)-dependent oxidoreductase [Mycolicibacterium fortuitum]|uniref:NAD-dependent epimerase/dehydratase family protein n=1 Tax=Mycolicibacterium fortuitum TaxID=1766 RepID=UPI0007EA0A92|nr:NAD(P)-dependent oxidoreductase [Mycolicibacterium fortuitum]NOQ99191.1 NAD(P)-dependent oxidoreductase [Mycolicibacterium fortuitum]OBB02429.1 dTDP-glucose 4,6-dehydratase [Mycolicibacterium fortuitum]